MKQMIKTGLFVSVLLFSAMANAKEVSPDNIFQIELPNKWSEIPKDILEYYKDQVHQMTGRKPEIDFGFQAPGAKDWMEYPYAIVVVKRTGRVPEKYVHNLKKINETMKNELQEGVEKRRSYLSNMNVGETVYDAKRKIIWTGFSTEVKGVGKVNAISAALLTSYGAIQFIGYSYEKDYDKYLPIYKKMVHSIKIKKSQQY